MLTQGRKPGVSSPHEGIKAWCFFDFVEKVLGKPLNVWPVRPFAIDMPGLMGLDGTTNGLSNGHGCLNQQALL